MIVYAYVPKTVPKACWVPYADGVRKTEWMVWEVVGTATLAKAMIFVDGGWWWPRRWAPPWPSASTQASKITLGWTAP